MIFKQTEYILSEPWWVTVTGCVAVAALFADETTTRLAKVHGSGDGIPRFSTWPNRHSCKSLRGQGNQLHADQFEARTAGMKRRRSSLRL